MKYEDDYFEEDKEFEECINKCPPVFKQASFVKEPMDIIRNVTYEKWRGSKRASTAWLLFGYTIRARCGNGIADAIYEKYYKKRKLIAARYTHQGLSEIMDYKDRRAIWNHLTACKKEGIFYVEEMPWTSRGRTRDIKIYVFGSWENVGGDNYIETVDMFTKFRKEDADSRLAKKFI